MGFSPRTYCNPITNRLERLFFAHPDAIALYKQHPDILLLDCTYKTNRFRIPLLNLCGVTGNKKTIQAALCFLSGEKEEDYEWAMTQFKELLEEHDIPWPVSMVTDRELALMNALDTVFPEVVHILCTWHVNMNILANCRKHFPKDRKDSDQANPQGHITEPKWESFLKD
jgi:hypothetical protein